MVFLVLIPNFIHHLYALTRVPVVQLAKVWSNWPITNNTKDISQNDYQHAVLLVVEQSDEF